MTHRIVKQPNGLYALWSTVVDDFILIDATAEDIIANETDELVRTTTETIRRAIAEIDSGNGLMSFKDCVRTVKAIHGDHAETLQMLGLTVPPVRGEGSDDGRK